MRVDYSARSGSFVGTFLIFFNMNVYCLFSLESPHRGDSNEYTQYTVFNIKKKHHPKLIKTGSYNNFSKGLKKEFETAVVNEPSVFEPSKFYCILKIRLTCPQRSSASILLEYFGFFNSSCISHLIPDA